MISDADLDHESPDEVPIVLAMDLAARFRDFSADKPGLGAHCAIKGVSELAYWCVDYKLVEAEVLAKQMEAMARYLREHMA